MPVDIKICGITCIEDARAALDCGVNTLGFNFWPESVRFVESKTAIRILDAVDHSCKAVGVFVNESRERVDEIVSAVKLDVVQLHGDEEPADFANLVTPLWRAVWVRDGSPEPSLKTWQPERVLVDATVLGEYGGTGEPADWVAAEQLARDHTVMLAGGLTPENVAQAIRAVRPAGVDTASGVESGPGKKDHDKIKRFVEAARCVMLDA